MIDYKLFNSCYFAGGLAYFYANILPLPRFWVGALQVISVTSGIRARY